MSGFLSLVQYIGLPLACLDAARSGRAPACFEGAGGNVSVPHLSWRCLHLLALNLPYPEIVGASVQLKPAGGTVALMFWGMCGEPSGCACIRYCRNIKKRSAINVSDCSPPAACCAIDASVAI